MEYIIFVLIIASCCMVQAQLCISSTLPAFTSPAASQIITSPVVATTVVDNSVSNALANALQLFIVSDLIQSRFGGNCAQNLFNGAVETVTPGFAVDVISPCTPVEVVTSAPVLETITPNIYGGLTETLTPMMRGYSDPIYPNTYVTETFIPNSYNWFDKASPLCADVATNVFNPVGGVSEIISPQPCGCGALSPCGCGSNNLCGLQEIVPPALNFAQNYFGGIPEVPLVSGPCGPNYFTPEVLPPMLPNFGAGIQDIITPTFMPSFPEVMPVFGQNCYNGLPEVISPLTYSQCADIISPNPFGPFSNEIITPIGPYGPISAEMLIPPSIPAQLKCNFGYTNSMPCINFNVEPLPFEPSYFNNVPNFYY